MAMIRLIYQYVMQFFTSHSPSQTSVVREQMYMFSVQKPPGEVLLYVNISMSYKHIFYVFIFHTFIVRPLTSQGRQLLTSRIL